MTAGADSVSTAAANAAFKATDFNDTITTTGANWDPAADSIDAGFGTDTFTITAAAATASVQAGKLRNVEIINVTADGGSAVSLSVANALELSQIWNSASTQGLSVDGLAIAVTVGLRGAIGDATSFAFANSGGSSDAATLSVSGATTNAGKAVTINAIETLTIANAGSSVLAGGISGNTLKAVVVNGTGSLTADLATAGNLTVETISTAGFNGSFSTDLTNLNAIRSYAGGAGVDRLIIDGEHVNDVTLDLGGGNDILRFTATGAPDTNAVTVVLGAGADTVAIDSSIGNVRSVGTNADLLKTLITISDVSKAEDAITLDVISPGTDRVTLLFADIIQIESATDLLAAAKVAASKTAIGKVLTFSYKGDAYIYQNTSTAALDAGDVLVKLTGVSVSDLNSANFELI